MVHPYLQNLKLHKISEIIYLMYLFFFFNDNRSNGRPSHGQGVLVPTFKKKN